MLIYCRFILKKVIHPFVLTTFKFNLAECAAVIADILRSNPLVLFTGPKRPKHFTLVQTKPRIDVGIKYSLG